MTGAVSPIRGSVAPSRDGLRIPSPPPVPSPAPSSQRGRSATNPGLGASPREAANAPRPLRPAQPPSLLTTQVGLGAVRLDPSGTPRATAPLSGERRFLVRPGERKGELILSALPEGVVPPSTVMSVRLVIDRDDEALAIGALVD